MARDQKKAPERPRARNTSVIREYVEALIVAAVFLGFTNNFVLKTFYIPSGSMENTLLIGDHLFVNRYIFGPRPTLLEKTLLPGREVQRGDIVIFRSPETPKPVDDDAYVIHRDEKVYPATGPYGQYSTGRDNWGPVIVPEDHLFCMGDNRDESLDSRAWGNVPLKLIKGRAVMVYWSYGGETSDGTWHGFGHRLKQLMNTALGFLTKTRWERTFKLIQ